MEKKEEKENIQEEVIGKNKWIKAISLVLLLIIIFSFTYYSIYSIYTRKDYSNAYVVEKREDNIIVRGKEKSIHDIQDIYLENKKLNYDRSDEEIVIKKEGIEKDAEYLKIIAKENEEKQEEQKENNKKQEIRNDNMFLKAMKKIDMILGKKENTVTIVVRV